MSSPRAPRCLPPCGWSVVLDAEPVVIGTLMTEGGGWKRALGEDAALVRTLGSMPLFDPDSSGALVEDWD